MNQDQGQGQDQGQKRGRERAASRAQSVLASLARLFGAAWATWAHVWVALRKSLARCGALAYSAAARVAPLVLGLLRVAMLSSAVALLTLGSLWMFWRRVPAPWVGVRHALWTGGVVERDFGPGVYFSPRFLESWTRVDGAMQLMRFGGELGEHSGAPSQVGPLELRTRDGNSVWVALAIPFRVVPGRAHALVRAGLKHTWTGLARETARGVLVRQFSELNLTQWNDVEQRQAQVARTLAELNAALARYDLAAKSILIEQVEFGEEVEKALQKRQLDAQKTLLSQVAAELERAQGNDLVAEETQTELARLEAERVAQFAKLEFDASVERDEILRPAASYHTLRRAEAERQYEAELSQGALALALAEARREELLQAALASKGGAIYMGRAAARSLQIESVKLDTRDPRVPSMLDLDQLAELLLGREREPRE